MERVKIGLVGCGGIAYSHIEGYKLLREKRFENFEITACCDINLDEAERKAGLISQFQSKPKVYRTLEEMLKGADLDAVDICLPNYLHHVSAIKCLKQGIHVLVEKPLAITVKAAHSIRPHLRRNLVFAVAENYRRRLGIRTTRWLVEEDRIGRVRFITQDYLGRGDRPESWRKYKHLCGGSLFFDLGVHLADEVVYLLGEVPEEIQGNYCQYEWGKGEITVDDHASMTAYFPSGAIYNLRYSAALPGACEYSRKIYGDKGYIYSDNIQSDVELFLAQEKTRVPFKELEKEFLENLPEGRKEWWFPRGITNTFAIEEYDFIQAILHGLRPEVGFWEGLLAMGMILSAYESHHLRGRRISFRDVIEGKIRNYQRDINKALARQGLL